MISWMLKVILWLQTAGGRGRGALVWIINGLRGAGSMQSLRRAAGHGIWQWLACGGSF